MGETLEGVDLNAVEVLLAHTRTRIEGCRCGWGMDASKLGQSHALHVWRELQRAVLDDHDARLRAEERARVAEEIAQRIEEADRHVDVTAADSVAIARAYATEEDQHV